MVKQLLKQGMLSVAEAKQLVWEGIESIRDTVQVDLAGALDRVMPVKTDAGLLQLLLNVAPASFRHMRVLPAKYKDQMRSYFANPG